MNEKNKDGITEEELIEMINNPIPVRKNETADKEDKKAQRRSRKAQRDKKFPDKLSFFLGLIILIFACIGVVLTGLLGVRYLIGSDEKQNEFASYNEFLSPVAAVDIDTFDDITAADPEQLLCAALWSILSNESTPDTYPYKGGYMLIPDTDVKSAYVAIFGPETSQSLRHMTVQGYNSTFEHDPTNGVYKIPVTTISPVYTPRVTAVEASGTSLIVTVEYLAAEGWARDDEGSFIAPEPDKVMQITLREISGSYYLSAIQTVSSTVPETVTYEQLQETESSQAENTTSQSGEKTTLGGRV